MIETENTVKTSISDMINQKEETVNLKIGHLKFFSQRRNREKMK